MDNSNSQSIASVPAVKQYLKYAEAAGVDSTPHLTTAGIDPACLSDNGHYISIAAMEKLIVLLAQATDDACFGLHSAAHVETASYSVLGYIALSCSTFREVQEKIPMYEKLVGDMGVTTVSISKGTVFQQWRCQFSDPLARRHSIENVMGSWLMYSRRFLNFDACESVWLEHDAPSGQAMLKDYDEIFGCPVLFNQSASGLRFSESLLDEPLQQANEGMLNTLLEHATIQLRELDKYHSVSAKVKNLLRLLLKQQSPSSETIAQELGMSSRTLQRKLDEEGTRYKTLLLELRLELALHYLQHSKLSLEEISHELGYSEPRSFYRSFKNWTGRTAGSYRGNSEGN